VDERETLLAALGSARRHVLGIVEGLSPADMRRPVLPSGWSSLALINHLAIDVERFWFRAVLANEAEAWATYGDDAGSAWQVSDDIEPDDVIELYHRECELADAVILATPLETPPAAWPEHLFGPVGLENLREIILHVLTETATHAGHLDAARELIDRRQWMVLT